MEVRRAAWRFVTMIRWARTSQRVTARFADQHFDAVWVYDFFVINSDVVEQPQHIDFLLKFAAL